MSGLYRKLFVEVGLVSGRNLQSPVIVGTCSAMSALCRNVNDVFLETKRVRRGWVSVGTCSAKSV